MNHFFFCYMFILSCAWAYFLIKCISLFILLKKEIESTLPK